MSTFCQTVVDTLSGMYIIPKVYSFTDYKLRFTSDLSSLLMGSFYMLGTSIKKEGRFCFVIQILYVTDLGDTLINVAYFVNRCRQYARVISGRCHGVK